MTKQYVQDLQDKQTVNSVFLVREKNLHVGKNGKSYLSVLLGDKTGILDGRIWDNAEEWAKEFEPDDFIQIRGSIQLFQNRKQCVINNLEVIDSFGVNLQDFLPSTKNDTEKMYKELMEIVQAVKNPFIKQILINTLEDSSIKPLFTACPAAKVIHHAYLGGLLEHVLSISKIMVFLGGHYPFLDGDLLLFGAIYHDIGKIWELKFDTSIGYTDVGRWVGHIPLGAELVEKKAAEISNFPYELKNILKHIVLSHHGRYEYGSPKIPSIIEAVVVGFIDDLDSKVNSIYGLMESEAQSGEKWTRFSSLYERHFFLGGMKNRE